MQETYNHRAKVESDPIGTDLAYLYISVRVCYDGKRITKAGVLDITPKRTHNALRSMTFDSRKLDPIHEYRSWRGRPKGSYFVKASGTWTQKTPLGVELSEDLIWASMWIFGNGNVDKNRQNG